MVLSEVAEVEEWYVWTYNLVILYVGYIQGDTIVGMLKVKNRFEYEIVSNHLPFLLP
jgi:hypothetical protein